MTKFWATISTCDIVVGKILPSIGWIGKFELEAMALGKPVMGLSLMNYMKNTNRLYIELLKSHLGQI